MPVGITYCATGSVTFSSRRAFSPPSFTRLLSSSDTNTHTPSSTVTTSFTNHQLPILLASLMDMKLVQIIGDRGVMGQYGVLVLPLLLQREGKAFLFSCVCLPQHDLYGCVLLEATVCAQIEG